MINNLTIGEYFVPSDVPKIVIAGCGRSGTLYMREVCKCFDLDVGHEGFLKDGISSWYIGEGTRAALLRARYSEAKCDVRFFHLVREPIAVINSMYKCDIRDDRAALDFYRRYINDHFAPHISKTAEWWLNWNKWVSELYPESFLLRVESMDEGGLNTFASALGLEVTDEIREKVKLVPTDTHALNDENEIPYYKMPYFDLFFPKLATKLKEVGRSYGYAI